MLPLAERAVNCHTELRGTAPLMVEQTPLVLFGIIYGSSSVKGIIIQNF